MLPLWLADPETGGSSSNRPDNKLLDNLSHGKVLHDISGRSEGHGTTVPSIVEGRVLRVPQGAPQGEQGRFERD